VVLAAPMPRNDTALLRGLSMLAVVALAGALVLGAVSTAAAAEERSDAVLAAVKPQRLNIPRGRASATRTFAVQVRNANQRTSGVGSGPITVNVLASALDCPGGTVVTGADFDPKAAGAQPVVTVAQGGSARGKVSVEVPASAVTTPSPRAPFRCRVRVQAAVTSPAGNVDPRATNDSVEVELDVVDRNDRGVPPASETVASPVKPLRVTLPAAGAPKPLPVKVKLHNAATTPAALTLSGDDGDCPAGTIASLDADAKSPGVQPGVTLGGRKSATVTASLLVRPPLWSTADGASPARCTVRVSASGAVADAEPGNDTVAITIDTLVPDDVSGAGCPSYATPATSAGNPPAVLPELSGLAASRSLPGVYWAHNDSGNAFELYALAADGTLLQSYALSGAAAVDIEDVAVARCGATSSAWCIYLADVGDNNAVRGSVAIYQLPEPDLTPGQTLPVTVLPFTYPGGPRDAESLVAETLSGRLFVVSKILTGFGEVFRLDGLGQPGGSTATLVATLGPSSPNDRFLTAAEAHPSGESVLLRSYGRVWELRRPGALLLEEVFGAPLAQVVAAAQPQGEAIAFTADGLGYLLGSEQLAPIRRVGCAGPDLVTSGAATSGISRDRRPLLHGSEPAGTGRRDRRSGSHSGPSLQRLSGGTVARGTDPSPKRVGA